VEKFYSGRDNLGDAATSPPMLLAPVIASYRRALRAEFTPDSASPV
jgi:hypothetical protein